MKSAADTTAESVSYGASADTALRLLVGEVGSRILLTSGSTTYVVDKLEQRGLVRRRPCESDRRALYVELTAEGEALIATIFPDHAKAVETAMAEIGRASC